MSRPDQTTDTHSAFSLNRRRVLTSTGVLGLAGTGMLALSACGNDSGNTGNGEAGTDTNADSGPWEYTDDRGETIALDAIPTNIVAFTGVAAALYDYGISVPAVFGPTTDAEGKADVQAGDMPVADLTVIGNAWGEFDIETFISTEPQVLISTYYDPAVFWYVPEEAVDDVEAICPTVGINMVGSTFEGLLESHTNLAASLGADIESDAVQSAATAYEDAKIALSEAAAANPVTVMACSGAAEIFYVSTPEMSADLTFFQELGVNFIVPDAVDEGGYFEPLSWENADKYSADILLLDARTSGLQPDALTEFPTWSAMPAVEANQIVGWYSEPRYSYAGVTPLLTALTEAITNATVVAK